MLGSYLIGISLFHLIINSVRTEHGFVSFPRHLQLLNTVPCHHVGTHQMFSELDAYMPEII